MSKQQKPSNQIANLCTDIMRLAISTADKQADVFCDYSGHTNCLEVRIHPNGWENRIPDESGYDKNNIELFTMRWNTEADIIAKLEAKIETIKQLS
jgi:hypothetical protein